MLCSVTRPRTNQDPRCPTARFIRTIHKLQAVMITVIVSMGTWCTPDGICTFKQSWYCYSACIQRYVCLYSKKFGDLSSGQFHNLIIKTKPGQTFVWWHETWEENRTTSSAGHAWLAVCSGEGCAACHDPFNPCCLCPTQHSKIGQRIYVRV